MKYMMDNDAIPESDACRATARIMASSEQVLADKTGTVKSQQLRQGALPLNVLEVQVDQWIASQKSTGKL